MTLAGLIDADHALAQAGALGKLGLGQPRTRAGCPEELSRRSLVHGSDDTGSSIEFLGARLCGGRPGTPAKPRSTPHAGAPVRHLARGEGLARGQTAGVRVVGYTVIVLALGIAMGTIGSLRRDRAGSSWSRAWQPWAAGLFLILLGLGFGLISQRASFAIPAVVMGVVLPFAWTRDGKSRNRP